MLSFKASMSRTPASMHTPGQPASSAALTVGQVVEAAQLVRHGVHVACSVCREGRMRCTTQHNPPMSLEALLQASRRLVDEPP